MSTGPVAFVLKGYPRLSETFIAQEIRALELRGLDIRIVSLRHPTDRARHPIHSEIRAPVNYLPEYLYQEPLRVWRGWRAARRNSGYRRAIRAWWHDLRRDPTLNRIRRFGQALTLSREIPDDVQRLHAHFIHTPASVARYTSLITGLPWTCSSHARDIWTSPDWEVREKLAECAWAVTCTAHNCAHLAQLAPCSGHVELVYHGLDFSRLPSPGAQRRQRDGRDPTDPLIVLSVGRAVEKKGYDDLLDALADLPTELHWRFVHVGGGPLRPKLQKRAVRSGIADRIEWLGPQPQQQVIQWYARADLFVLACRVASDGDRDGLPNVLGEAQSQGLPCLSTRLSAVPELISDGETGLLVEPADPLELAAALERMITDPELRGRLARAGYAKVRERFSFEGGIVQLAGKFGLQVDEASTDRRRHGAADPCTGGGTDADAVFDRGNP